MEEEFSNFQAKSNDTYHDILKNLDERAVFTKASPNKTTSSSSVNGNSSSNVSTAPVFDPDSSAKTSTQKTARGRSAPAKGRGRGRGASTSAANESKTTSRSTAKPKMAPLFQTLGTASKSARPQRAAAKADTSKAIYISDSD